MATNVIGSRKGSPLPYKIPPTIVTQLNHDIKLFDFHYHPCCIPGGPPLVRWSVSPDPRDADTSRPKRARHGTPLKLCPSLMIPGSRTSNTRHLCLLLFLLARHFVVNRTLAPIPWCGSDGYRKSVLDPT